MKRNLFAPVRRILPPTHIVVQAAIFVLILDATWFFAESRGFAPKFMDQTLLLRDFVIAGLLAAFGVFRVVAFHPMTRTEYRDWLKTTPWKRGVPLPLGPVSPTWGDLILVGAVACLVADPRTLNNLGMSRPPVIGVILISAFAHAVTLSVIVWFTRPRHAAYVSLFCLALTLQMMSWASIGAVVALAAGWSVALLGLHHSWELFPWDETVDWGSRLRSRWRSAQSKGGTIDDDPAPDRVPPSELGWPFSSLSPWMPPIFVSKPERMLIALLVGCWLHAALCQIRDPDFVNGAGMGLLGYGTMGLFVARLMALGANHSSPMGLFARLVTLRWIIPRYDQILFGPLAVLIVPGVMASIGQYWLEIPAVIMVPSTAVATLWTFILAGPDPIRWKLTAPARIVPGTLNKRNYDELT